MKKNRKIIILLSAIIVIVSVVLLIVFKNKREDFTGKVKGHLMASYSDLGITNLNDDDLLQFCDAATGEKIVLCDKPNCKHDNNDCNALFKDYAVHLSAIYNDRLFIVIEEEDRNFVLYEADVNGSNRKKFVTLGKLQGSFDYLFLDNYLIIQYSKTYDMENIDSVAMELLEEPISGVAIINLKEQEVDYIPEKTDYEGGIQRIHMYEDKVYYSYLYMDIEYDFLDFENIDFDYVANHTFYRIYSYDISSGTESTLYEGQNIYVEEINEEYAIIREYMNEKNVRIYAFNLLNQEEELIIEGRIYGNCIIDGDKLVYLSYSSEDVEAEEELSHFFYYYDLISKESFYIGVAKKDVIASTELFLGDYAYILYDDEIGDCRPGCIPKEDFYKGDFDKVIKLLN